MTFQFPEWSTAFSPAFHESAKAMLENALNKVSSDFRAEAKSSNRRAGEQAPGHTGEDRCCRAEYGNPGELSLFILANFRLWM